VLLNETDPCSLTKLIPPPPFSSPSQREGEDLGGFFQLSSPSLWEGED